MKAILANPKRIKEIKKIHQGIRETYIGMTLEDILIVGFNWDRDKIDSVINNEFVPHGSDEPINYDELKKFFYDWKWHGDEQLSKFKVCNQPAICRHARYRSEFLQEMKNKGCAYLLEMDYISLPQLEELSCYSVGYATVSYAIKCFLLANYGDGTIQAYKGVQPQTGPVHNALEHLYGHKFSNYAQTVLCNDLAVETGLSSTDINTAFYTMG